MPVKVILVKVMDNGKYYVLHSSRYTYQYLKYNISSYNI